MGAWRRSRAHPFPMERLSNLIRRLSTNHDGEVVATVRAIERALRAEGHDWHDLADQLTTEIHEPPSLHAMAAWLHDRPSLSQWERDFVPSVLGRLRAGARLTDKQEQALRRAYARHGGPGLGT